jgi:NADH-quinone oxidoreductase subunit F
MSVAATSAPRVIVGMGSCGIAAGAYDVEAAFKDALAGATDTATVEMGRTGCMGLCYREVMVEIRDGEATHVYGDVTAERVPEIVSKHLVGGEPIQEWLILGDEIESVESKLLAGQTRIVLRNCGHIDPESIDDYIARDGYVALRDTIASKLPADVVEIMKASGLRGRGGAGFSTGMKWQFAASAPGDKKYVVCNADEGDPGAFMDRSVLESDPHSVLEGMAICAFAIGADEGYVYCRAEYPLAIKRLNIAIKQAEERGLLGKNIMGSGFDFTLKVKEGAGAFVCGEETALIASLEGQRGMPRIRPPFPATSGLWGKPTNINNVETFANVAWILRNGAEAYSSIGSGTSKGTKVFALTGKVKRSGLVEVPMGMTLRELVFDVAGGMSGDRPAKAVQMGGPSGGCVPEALLDTPIEYEALMQVGAIVGSGGVVVVDESTCMVDLARFFLSFTQDESCGKCVPCRIGTKRMLELVTRVTEGEGVDGDIEELERLANTVKSASLCGLGQTAPNPVLTTLKYFRHEYEEHIAEKRCRAAQCTALSTYIILSDLCRGCLVCKKHCPTNAISGELKQPHKIDANACIKCGVCVSHCAFDAITRV